MVNIHQFPQRIDRISRDEDFIEGKKVKKRRLINKLNALNFKGGALLVKLRHVKYKYSVIRNAIPQPCLGDELECIWADTTEINKDDYYQLIEILVPDGPELILIKSEAASFNDKGVRILLPEVCHLIGLRRVQRNPCNDVKIQLLQNGVSFSGILNEFSPLSFQIEVDPFPPQTFAWIDPAISVTVIFLIENQVVYSGTCKIIKQAEKSNKKTYILEPLDNQTRRYKPKEFRSTRQKLLPLPNLVFQHPLTKKMESLKILDISGSGFAVEEDENNSVLLPGMIIPAAELSFAGSFKVNCRVQVVYKKFDNSNESNTSLKCGMVLLDMDILEHRRLLSLLYHATDEGSYLNTQMDMDALWDFFFDTGFIYPQKYVFFEINKKKIRETYEKLYSSENSIAQNFIYQEKGHILAHMTMLRFYLDSWLIQHHAARRTASNHGLSVLNQVGRFLNDSHRLYSAHMKYAFCYYRPENKFPERVFGEVCRQIDNPKGCSLDIFAYFHYQKSMNQVFESGASWKLTKSKPTDLAELKNFYEYASGGLMLNALGLEADAIDIGTLAAEFNSLGFKRERQLFSLWKNGSLKALIMANMSDIGLNFSGLTNCIHAFVTDPDNIPRNVFFKALSQIVLKFEKEDIPILLYPPMYAENQSISYEKLYKLWILNTEYGDDYFRSLKRLLKHIQH